MKRVVFAAVAALSLSACASSVLTVEQPYAGQARYQQAQLVYDDSSVSVDADNLEYTREHMKEAFFGGESPIFTEGDGMTVRWRYVGFNEGSRVGRYLMPGIAGGSKIVLEADFVDANGAVMSTVRGEASVGGGFAGGSNKTGIDKAVKEIAEYASAKFR